MRFAAMGLALVVSMLSGPAQAQSLKEIDSAKTAKQLVALGATALDAKAFRKSIVGRKMAGDGWWWTIDKDGTTSSAATDGSWTEDKAPWTMKGDTYCIIEKGKETCRTAYVVGDYMRMAEKNGKLSPWTAKYR